MKKFNTILTSIIRRCSLLLSYIIPINNKLLLFVSFPDFGDNSYAVFRYLIKSNRNDKYQFCWLVDNKECKDRILDKVKEWNGNIDNVSIIKRKSIKGIFMCYRARYLFNTVGIFVNIVFRQKDKRINMWHGMPLKQIGSNYKNGDITISTSDLFRPLMAKGLKIPENNVLVIGQPRNDLLFCPEELSDDLKVILQGFKKIGIWMPTFRRSLCDKQYSDGVFSKDMIAFIPFVQLKELNDFLAKQKTLLIIKFHPMDVLQLNKFETYTNIVFLRNDNFNQNNLYPLLANCDFLISDYSSVIVDFEILDRPIGITVDDIDAYRRTRGLNFDKIPGKYISSFEEFTNFIHDIRDFQIGIEQHKPSYIFNKYKDNHSSERLIEYLHL